MGGLYSRTRLNHIQAMPGISNGLHNTLAQVCELRPSLNMTYTAMHAYVHITYSDNGHCIHAIVFPLTDHASITLSSGSVDPNLIKLFVNFLRGPLQCAGAPTASGEQALRQQRRILAWILPVRCWSILPVPCRSRRSCCCCCCCCCGSGARSLRWGPSRPGKAGKPERGLAGNAVCSQAHSHSSAQLAQPHRLA